MPSPMQCREDDRGQGHYGGRGPSRLLDDSTVGFVARGERDRERCTYRGQTKGNLYNDRRRGTSALTMGEQEPGEGRVAYGRD